MSRLLDELRDPWGPLLAAVVGGLSWAVGTPALAAVAVGAVVYGAKAAVGAALGDGTPAPPRPASGTAAAGWLQRAETAVRSLDQMAASDRVGSVADTATKRAAAEADDVLASMRELGGHVVAVAQALRRSDAPGLDAEAERLGVLAKADPGNASAQRSAQAVRDRVAVRDRLRHAQSQLEGRLQSSALGLEGLVARVAEVRAAAACTGELDLTSDSLSSLTTEIEGLRVGLADVAKMAQQALGGSG